MRQANAEIGVEFAGYFPAVSLSGLIGYSGNPFNAEFGPTNPIWSFGASLAQPLFNGGLTTAEVEAARQTYDADVATYRETVLTAIQQVEDNLSGNSHPIARSQGVGRRRSHLPAGDADHAQRISGRHPGLHRRHRRRSPAAVGRRIPVVDPRAGADRRGEPHRRARRRLEPIEAARRGGADVEHSPALTEVSRFGLSSDDFSHRPVGQTADIACARRGGPAKNGCSADQGYEASIREQWRATMLDLPEQPPPKITAAEAARASPL